MYACVKWPRRWGPEARRWTSPFTVLLVEDDRADAILVEELIADAAAEIQVVWAQSMEDAERSTWRPHGPTAYCWT